MANETAKIVNPDRTILSPDPTAGCSLADSITLRDLQLWKAEHPGAVVLRKPVTPDQLIKEIEETLVRRDRQWLYARGKQSVLLFRVRSAPARHLQDGVAGRRGVAGR